MPDDLWTFFTFLRGVPLPLKVRYRISYVLGSITQMESEESPLVGQVGEGELMLTLKPMLVSGSPIRT